MIMIPISIAYFILGFVSCFVLIIIFAVIGANKEAKRKKEFYDKFVKNLVDDINSDKVE